MRTRLQFHEILCNIHGDEKVYFQPPPQFQVGSECIIYKLSGDRPNYANNKRYNSMRKYEVILVTTNPDNPMYDTLLNLEYSSFDRHYCSHGLNHFVFTIYY